MSSRMLFLCFVGCPSFFMGTKLFHFSLVLFSVAQFMYCRTYLHYFHWHSVSRVTLTFQRHSFTSISIKERTKSGQKVKKPKSLMITTRAVAVSRHTKQNKVMRVSRANKKPKYAAATVVCLSGELFLYAWGLHSLYVEYVVLV